MANKLISLRGLEKNLNIRGVNIAKMLIFQFFPFFHYASYLSGENAIKIGTNG
jgi:hypothetical protein